MVKSDRKVLSKDLKTARKELSKTGRKLALLKIASYHIHMWMLISLMLIIILMC